MLGKTKGINAESKTVVAKSFVVFSGSEVQILAQQQHDDLRESRNNRKRVKHDSTATLEGFAQR